VAFWWGFFYKVNLTLPNNLVSHYNNKSRSAVRISESQSECRPKLKGLLRYNHCKYNLYYMMLSNRMRHLNHCSFFVRVCESKARWNKKRAPSKTQGALTPNCKSRTSMDMMSFLILYCGHVRFIALPSGKNRQKKQYGGVTFFKIWHS